jgi:hypothetical protein
VPKNTAASWHGEAKREDILNGKYRGTLLFLEDGDTLRTTGARYYQDNGFELLYGGKVVQLAGPHPDGGSYQLRGKPKALPRRLLDFLRNGLPEDNVSAPAIEDPADARAALDPLLAAFQAKANADPEYTSLGGHLRVIDTHRGKQLEGLCVGHKEHTNRQGGQNMRVYLREDEPQIHCFHQSCWRARQVWLRRIREQIRPVAEVVITPENVLLQGEVKEIAEVFDDQARYKLVVAPTGSGKTHAVVVHVSTRLAAARDERFVIICSSKAQMRQLAERFADVLESDNINDLGIDLIEATGSLKVGKACSRDRVRASGGTRVAITHYTYVSRRRFSECYYAFLQFIDASTHVFIDEVDAFIESQTSLHPLGSRKRQISSGGKTKYSHVSKCGMFHGFNNCLNCTMHKYDGNRLDVDDYHNLGYVPVAYYIEGTRMEELAHIDVDSRLAARVRVGVSEVSMLRQTDDPGPMRFDDDCPAADFQSIFEDHLNSGYLPTVHRPVILHDDEEITRDALIARFNLQPGTSASDIPEEERRRLRFPSRACNVLTVTTIDRRPLLAMADARSVTTLTATLSPVHERFLAHMLPGLKRFDVAPREDRKMDKIILIGMARTIPLKMYLDGHLKFEKMFRYRETKADAVRDFEALRNGDVPIRLGYDRTKYMLTSDEEDYGRHKILQTYAFSTLGRGVDFAAYDLVDINASIYKPLCAFVTDDPDELRGQLEEDRINSIVQNVGRILRRPDDGQRAVKIVVIERMEEEPELALFAEALSGMSHEPVETWWAPELLHTIEVCEHISRTVADKALPTHLPTDYLVLIERAEAHAADGKGKTAIKEALRWQTVRKKLTKEEAEAVEQGIDRALQACRDDSERMVTDKVAKRREQRHRRIQELRARGLTDGQIRSRMNVYSGKPWPKSEQKWFEQVLRDGTQ